MDIELIEEDPAIVADRVARFMAAPAELLDLDMLAAFAAELAERVALLASLPAEPGDSAVEYLEHRAEALELVDLIGAGLQRMAVPA